MNRDKTIKDKNLAIKEIKKHRYQIENVDKKFLGDKEIITAALNSKNPYEWAIDPVLEFIKKSKIKDKKFIKYILSKNGLALNWINSKYNKDKELALIALKQNGHIINFLSKKLQLDRKLISLALKTGRTDKRSNRKINLFLPELSYWQVVSDNTKIKGPGKVNGLKIWNDWENRERYYWGETFNGIPNGKGYSETYETDGIIRKTFKVIPKIWKDNYLKNSSKKRDGYILVDKYIGEWKNGMFHGQGEFIEYHGPEYLINKDGSAKPLYKYIGKFVEGKKEGKFQVYNDMGREEERESDWSTENFKNDLDE
jgi:hypothetical protein